MGGNYDDDLTKTVYKFTAWFDSMFTPVVDFTFCIDFSYALGVRKLVNVHHRAGYNTLVHKLR